MQPGGRLYDMTRMVVFESLAVCALALSSCSAPAAQNQQPLPAVINADCAPWDGASFTISIPMDTGRLVTISIYQAPDIPRRVTFTLPDASGRVGNAVYRPEFGPDEPVRGTLVFQGVASGVPVEGEIDIESAGGFRYHGPIRATWGQTQAMCG